MIVHVPSPLLAYTQTKEVIADGATLAEVFADLERRYPGMRFRLVNEQGQLREHIKVFINQQIAGDLSAAVQSNDVVRIIMAISGG
jgi:sulfur-carrier protein